MSAETRRAAALMALTLLLGCIGSAEPGSGGAVRDSAGVRVIDLPPGEGLAELHVDETWGPPPGLELGDLVDVAVAPDGRVALLDGLAARATVLSPGGAVLATFGRPGSGPGELRAGGLRDLVVTDSSVLVPDLPHQRLPEFSVDGQVLGVLPFPGPGIYAVDWRAHPGGGLAFRALDPGGDRLLRWRGDAFDTLFVFEGAGTTPNRILPPTPLWDVGSEDRLVIGRSDGGSLELRAPDAGWIAHLPTSARELTDAERSHLRDLVVQSVEREGGLGGMSLDEVLARVSLPDRAPVMAGLRHAPDGSVWVRLAQGVLDMGLEALRVGRADGFGGRDWLILGPDGLLLQRIRFPPGFAPRSFSDGWAYGIRTDSLGIQTPARVRVASARG